MRYAASALDGEGARLFGGRWNTKGTRVVYLSDSPALAALEVLVHTRSEEDLQDYLILEVGFDEVLVETHAPEDLPADWTQPKAPISTQAIGDRWANEGRSLLLKVPSAVIPQQSNFLLNPLHKDMNKLEVGELAPFRFDPRLNKRNSSKARHR
jgi:RES domain-containing protein